MRETELAAATEVLSDMPAAELAQRLVEANTTMIRYRTQCTEERDRIANLQRTIEAARAVLSTVVKFNGRDDLLALCEAARRKILDEGVPFK